jgi:hypothetical protein
LNYCYKFHLLTLFDPTAGNYTVEEDTDTVPSGAEMITNDERAIVTPTHVLVWTDTMSDKRVTVLALIPSGTRSKDIEAYIECAADNGHGVLVLKIKTIDEWMDPNLLLLGDDAEHEPFYSDTHALITAFRESVKEWKTSASTAETFSYHRIMLPFPVEQQFCDVDVPCSHKVVVYPTADGTDLFYVVAHTRAVRDNFHRQKMMERRISSPHRPHQASTQHHESPTPSMDTTGNNTDEMQDLRNMIGQLAFQQRQQAQQQQEQMQQMFAAFNHQQQQAQQHVAQQHAAQQHAAQQQQAQQHTAQQHAAQQLVAQQHAAQQAQRPQQAPRTPPAAFPAAAAISPPVAQLQQVVPQKRSGRTISTPTSKGPPKAPKGS